MSSYVGFPEVLKVSAYDIRVIQLVSDEEGEDNVTWGKWHHASQLIKLKESQPSKFFAVDTALHEILHAIFCIYNLFPAKGEEFNEERTVTVLSTALTDLFRTNPELVKWLFVNSLDEVCLKARSRESSKAGMGEDGRSGAGRKPSRRVRRNTRMAARKRAGRRID